MNEQRPRIGITMRIELETNRFYLSRYYSEAVEAAGGLPVNIPLIPRADYIAGVMDSLEGVLLPGSDSDMDPQRYGQHRRGGRGPAQRPIRRRRPVASGTWLGAGRALSRVVRSIRLGSPKVCGNQFFGAQGLSSNLIEPSRLSTIKHS